MSHIHNYNQLLADLRQALQGWRNSKQLGVTLTDELLARLMLDFTLDQLGIGVIDEEPSHEHPNY